MQHYLLQAIDKYFFIEFYQFNEYQGLKLTQDID